MGHFRSIAPFASLELLGDIKRFQFTPNMSIMIGFFSWRLRLLPLLLLANELQLSLHRFNVF